MRVRRASAFVGGDGHAFTRMSYKSNAEFKVYLASKSILCHLFHFPLEIFYSSKSFISDLLLLPFLAHLVPAAAILFVLLWSRSLVLVL
jgi:hypothetical protein